jgi:Polysaccharide deacetylase
MPWSAAGQFSSPTTERSSPGSCSRDSSCDESVGPAALCVSRTSAARPSREPGPAAVPRDDGQIQLGNHTWSHPDLTKLPLTARAKQLRHNHDFLWKTYGIDVRPYFRPPYGQHDAHVDKISGGRVRWRTTCPSRTSTGSSSTSSAPAGFGPSRLTTYSSSRTAPITKPHLSLLPHQNHLMFNRRA